MVSKSVVDDFLSQQKLAIVGVSRSGKKFGNVIYKDLKKKEYLVFPVNPNAEKIEGDRCFPGLEKLPESVDGVVINVPPSETEKVLQVAAKQGIRRVWLQQGSESEQAIKFCEENNFNFVHGECILMFAEPVGSFHKFHRWVWKILGKLPK